MILNFTPVVREGYELSAEKGSVYVELLNSDSDRFGGSGVENQGKLRAVKVNENEDRYSVFLRLPPLGAVILRKQKGKSK